MPRILSYTPPWLSHPSPGYDLFSPPAAAQAGKSAHGASQALHTPHHGPRRVMASRGAEIFVATSNNIRWADLSMLKDDWEVKKAQRQQRSSRGVRERSATPYEDPLEGLQYKTLKVAVHEPIRQIIPSPNGDLLAIATSHTVHIAVIPDSNHLDPPDSGPLKVRTYTLGPTTHVLSQAPVVSVVWHPLGATGECLVTVTSDAVVRLWELDRKNRASFDQPTIDLDLPKLHYATSIKDDIRSNPLSSNRGYSMDRIGMEAASATFGGSGTNAEHGWAPMTLWVAMTEGDVYALCPLLPAKWRSPTAVIPSLTTTVLAKKAYAEGPTSHEEQQRIFEAQYQWLAELDEQEPMIYVGQDTQGDEWRMPVYSRPALPGAIPKLQGPFRIMPGDQEDDLELSDMHVIPARLDIEELLTEDEGVLVDDGGEGLSATVVCLSSTGGRVYITLCLEDVEGQWLPLQSPRTPEKSDPDAQPELTLLEALDTLRAGQFDSETEWPTFTADVSSRHALFVNHSQGTFYLSLSPWLNLLERELQSQDATGASFRMAVVTKSAGTIRERLIRFENTSVTADFSAAPPAAPVQASACIVFDDSDLGYFLLALDGIRPHAAELDSHDPVSTPFGKQNPISLAETSYSPQARDETPSSPLLALPPAPPRQPFQSPAIFTTHKTALASFAASLPQRKRHAMKSTMRLDATALDVLAAAHKVVAPETHALSAAAAEVFRRCERLLAELRAQVGRANDVAGRVEQVIGEDADYEEEESEDGEQEGGELRGSKRLEARLQRAAAKNVDLAARHERLRRRLAGVAARPLSENEGAWAREIGRLKDSVGLETEHEDGEEQEEGEAEDKAQAEAAGSSDDDEEEEGSDEADEADEPSKHQSRQPRQPANVAAAKKAKEAHQRLASARAAAHELLAQINALAPEDGKDAESKGAAESTGPGTPDDADDASMASADGPRADRTAGKSWKVPADVRLRRVALVMGLLERESALVEAARDRLERLRAGAGAEGREGAEARRRE